MFPCQVSHASGKAETLTLSFHPLAGERCGRSRAKSRGAMGTFHDKRPPWQGFPGPFPTSEPAFRQVHSSLALETPLILSLSATLRSGSGGKTQKQKISSRRRLRSAGLCCVGGCRCRDVRATGEGEGRAVCHERQCGRGGLRRDLGQHRAAPCGYHQGIGLHSSTSQLNGSTFCGIRWVVSVTQTAQA